MPNNIHFVSYAKGSGRLTISGDELFLLISKFPEDDRPEMSFFENYDDDGIELDETIVLNDISWYGEYSGWSFEDFFLATLIPKTSGEAIIIVVWDSGDVVRYVIEDGKAILEEQLV